MREALLIYPPVAEQARVRRQAANAYATLPAPGMTLTEFMGRQYHNYIARRQTRAALALSDIHTPEARAALARADSPLVRVQYRSDVANTIHFLNTAWGAVRYTGDVPNRDPGFGDSVIVRAKPAEPFSTQAVVAMDSSPFPPAELILSRSPSILVFAAVGTAGAHTASLVDQAASPQAQLFNLAIVSQSDRNDRHTRTCATLACYRDSAEVVPAAGLPHVAFLSLTSVGAKIDTIDVFKITAPAALPLTARLDWHSPSPVNLDLRWRSCTTLLPVGNAAGATASKPEETSVVIPMGECWMLIVSGPTALGVPSVWAKLRISTF